MSYSNEERVKAREAVRRLNDLAAQTKTAAERGIHLSEASEKVVAALTQTPDGHMRAKALQAIAEDIQKRHLGALLPLAYNEFAAFCEYMEPEEPPESKWHMFLTDKLQQIETDPALNRFILNCPPGHAKPLSVQTPVLMADGSWSQLGEIEVGDFVVSHSGEKRLVTAVHEQGVLPLLKITTLGGRVILSAYDHSFKVGDAWKEAQALRPGDRFDLVLRPNDLNTHSTATIDEFRFAAYAATQGAMSWMTGRNRTTQYRAFRLFSADIGDITEMSDCMTRLGLKHSTKPRSGGYNILMSIPDSDNLAEPFRLDDRKDNMRVPDFVLKADNDQLREYLSLVFSYGGDLAQRYNYNWLTYYSHSLGFLYDLQKLLGRFHVGSIIEFSPKGARSRLVIKGPDLAQYLHSGLRFEGKNGDKIAPLGQPARVDRDVVQMVELHAPGPCRCLTVEEDHTFIADGVVVHNSTYASRKYVAWRIGRDPDQRIIGGGHSSTFVENEFSKKIRSMVGTPEYQAVFPGVVIDHNSRAAGQWNIAGFKGQYVARGVGGSIHGFRATFICIDDPYASIEMAESATMREKVNTWFTTDVGSRLLPLGKVFVIMTRFHEEDLTGYLMNMNPRLPDNSKWNLVEAPAICYDTEKDVLGRNLGEVLWDYYDLSHYVTKKTEWKYQRYALVYQQLADASSDGSIASHFKFYEKLPHQSPEAMRKATDANQVDDAGRPRPERKDYFRRVILSVDTASKTSQRADYSVVQVWGETHDHKYYLFDQYRGKVEFNQLIEKIERMAIKYSVDHILVEDKGQGTAYIQARGKTDYQTRKAPAPLVAINPGSQSKEFRWDEITPLIREGIIHVPEFAPWIDAFIKEVGQFPEGNHDDMVDAASQAIRWLKSQRTRYGSKKVGSMG